MPLLREVGDRLSSSYLRQHVDNPVDWWTWGPDALARARDLDRPIFLSVGYAACHWCHVMAHECFEDPAIAALLNDTAVAIKVDREERPDVDALYMAATQLMTGQGGWPMSVFLLPDGDPFFAGTYFPPADRPGLMGFPRLVQTIGAAWRDRRGEIEHQARDLHAALAREVAFVDHLAPHDERLDLAQIRRRLREEIVARVDPNGGVGPAPKFPRADYLDALLDGDDASQAALSRTLDAMSRRGLYDHVAGGFARYSVDAVWHVPHFEKMLYDNALLAHLYWRADRRRGGGSEWADVARATVDFVERDLRVAAGYASSLDADAGGVEGAHVTWTLDEVRGALEAAGRSSDVDAVVARWRLGEETFEGRAIPQLTEAEGFAPTADYLPALAALRAQRARRVQPGRDDKVVLEWNAMFATALLAGEPADVARGVSLLASLLETHRSAGTWWRTEAAEAFATAADLAWLIDAFVDAFEATGEDRWTDDAAAAASYLLAHHWDGERPTPEAPSRGAGLFTQCDLVSDLTLRPKEVFDNATPAAHAVATRALARLAQVTGDAPTLVVAERLVDLAASLIATHPMAAPSLVAAAGFALEGVEVVVPGGGNELSDHVRSRAMSRVVLVTGTGSSPLLVGRREGLAYVCRAGVCHAPVDSVAELAAQLASLGA